MTRKERESCRKKCCNNRLRIYIKKIVFIVPNYYFMLFDFILTETAL